MKHRITLDLLLSQHTANHYEPNKKKEKDDFLQEEETFAHKGTSIEGVCLVHGVNREGCRANDHLDE